MTDEAVSIAEGAQIHKLELTRSALEQRSPDTGR